MDAELMRQLLICRSFFDGVSVLAVECELGNIKKERLAERVIELSKKYEAALKNERQ